MAKPLPSTLIYLLIATLEICTVSVHAQWEGHDVDGIELGQKLVLKPQVEARGAYDNRVIRSVGSGAEGDFYSDLAAAVVLVNKPSRYDLWLKGRYGYRTHSEYSKLNDDFYTAAASFGTAEGPLLWKLSSDYTKSLDYNTLYNPGAGQTPDSVLAQASKRSLTKADVSYDSKRFSKTALVPRYTFEHYYRDYIAFDSTDEWQIHNTSLRLRHQYSAHTRFAVGGAYSLQANEVEDGLIATVLAGVEHRMTKKTSWVAELGYAFADYDISGTDQGFVSRLRGNWSFSKKVSLYVFGGNNFQPGYNGNAARWVYRLGYGAQWQVVPKFKLKGALLHDYQDLIGNNTSTSALYGEMRHFVDLKAEYEPIDSLSLIAAIRHNNDQYDPAQTILNLGVVYRFY